VRGTPFSTPAGIDTGRHYSLYGYNDKGYEVETCLDAWFSFFFLQPKVAWRDLPSEGNGYAIRNQKKS